MALEAVIPASVLASNEVAGIAVLSYLERRLYWNIDTGLVSSRDDDRIQLDKWVAKRGDLERIAVRVVNEKADYTTEKIRLPENCVIAFAAVLKNDFGGQVLADATLTFDGSDPEDPKYVGFIDWGRVELNDAIEYGEGTEKGYLELTADIEIEQRDAQTGALIARISTTNLPIQVINDVRRSGQQSPTSASRLVTGIQYRDDIQSLIGGGATALDGQKTVGVPAGKCLVVLREDGRLRDWLLEDDPAPGLTVEDPQGGVVLPDDYDPQENAKIWVRKR